MGSVNREKNYATSTSGKWAGRKGSKGKERQSPSALVLCLPPGPPTIMSSEWWKNVAPTSPHTTHCLLSLLGSLAPWRLCLCHFQSREKSCLRIRFQFSRGCTRKGEKEWPSICPFLLQWNITGPVVVPTCLRDAQSSDIPVVPPLDSRSCRPSHCLPCSRIFSSTRCFVLSLQQSSSSRVFLLF